MIIPKLILGIDPGLATTGYGLIEKTGDKLKLIKYGTILTAAHTPFDQRLKSLHDYLRKIIQEYQPSLLALEELFFANNAKTALLVGQARGVITLCAVLEKIPVCEFTPLQVKQAVTGFGRADKAQIQQMVKILLNLKEAPKPDDAADALAIAICASSYNKIYVD